VPVLFIVLAVLAALVCAAVAPARAADLPRLRGLHGGNQIYLAACAACHGPGGAGTPEYVSGFERPDTFPHFNKCDESAPENTRDWTAIIRDGGPARGFSQIMPAFGSALTPQQIEAVVQYLRSLCTDRSWPPGELNVPRALITDKAFPESEAILTSTLNASGAPGISNEFEYEHLLGSSSGLDVEVPFGWVHKPAGGLFGGIGDLTAGVKHVLLSHLHGSGPLYERSGSILAVQGEVTLATGNASQGLGGGQSGLGGFVAFDQLLPAQGFLQLQAGGERPLHTESDPASLYLYAVIGRSFNQGMGFGRQWSPMLELTAKRDLRTGAVTDWGLLPEFQVTLSTRQHVRADIGYLLPLNAARSRQRQIMLYVLWDWFDGGLFEGW
jgi:mono/diheme cytochrome c family protein